MVASDHAGEHLAEFAVLHHVGGKPGLDLAFEQALQQFDRQVLLGQAAHLGQELVVQQPDVGLVQPDGIKDVDHAAGDHRLADDLPDGQFALLVGAPGCGGVLLGQDDFDALQESHLLAHRLGFVQRAAQGEGLAHGERRVGKALLAIAPLRGLQAQHMVGRAGQRFVAAGQEAAVIKAVQHGAQHVDLFHQHAVGLLGVDRRAAPAV